MSGLAVLLMASWTERSFDLITEVSKQIITLSTGVIALGMTFNKSLLGVVSPCARGVLGWSWIMFLAALTCAVWTLMASVGAQGRHSGEQAPDPYATSIKIPATLEVVTFGLGLLLTVIAGWLAL